MVALEVIAGKKDAADPDEYATKKSTIEKRLKRAKEAITGMTVCTFTSASEKVGEWMALKTPPKQEGNRVTIDSEGWYCANGGTAQQMQIQRIYEGTPTPRQKAE